MKKIVFICSHLHSVSAALYDALNSHPRIQGYKTDSMNSYFSPLNLIDLTNRPHKLSNRSAIYMDELLCNHSFYTKIAYKKCQFIYLIRDAEPTLNLLVGNKQPAAFAARYYTYRLGRLCEMAKRTPGAVFMTWEDLVTNRSLSLVEKYLGLKEPIQFSVESLVPFITHKTGLLDKKLLDLCQDSYEKHLYFLRNQDLQFWS